MLIRSPLAIDRPAAYQQALFLTDSMLLLFRAGGVPHTVNVYAYRAIGLE